MRQAARVPEPELSFVRRMADTDGRFEHHGDYAIWCGHRKAGEPPLALYELHQEGVVPVRRQGNAPVLHRVATGTPFYVAHLAGFWMNADTDAIWLESAQRGAAYYALMLGGVADAFTWNELLWVCRSCRAELARHRFHTHRHGFDRFLPFALEKVRAFNADAAARTCPKCAKVHPHAYGFHPDRDDALERAARAAG